jgi:tetratricopeptide (TPR) repeat protein
MASTRRAQPDGKSARSDAERRRAARKTTSAQETDVDAALRLSHSLVKKGAHREAVDAYVTALQKASGSNTRKRVVNALDVLCRSMGSAPEAGPLFRKLVEVRPSARNHVDFARYLLGQGRVEEAASQCGAALQMSPTNASALEVTERVARELVRRDEGSFDAHMLLAKSLFAQRRFKEAGDSYWTAFVIDPNDLAAREEGAKAYRQLAVRANPRDRVSQRLRELAPDPKRVAVHTRLARSLIDADRLEDAESEYHRALELDPTNRIALRGLKRIAARRRGEISPSDNNLTAQQRVSWTILPDGELPWTRLETALRPVLRSAGYRYRDEDAARLKFLADLNPSFTAVGREGFSGYVLFGFEDKGIYVLESPLYGNATYVLDGDWKTLSRRSKAELLRRHLHRDRIIHTKSWQQRIRSWV